MLGLKLSLNTTPRSLRGVARLGTLCSAFAVLTLLTGCPLTPTDPCASTSCDDSDACTTDTCDGSSGTAVCSSDAVVCATAGDVCNPADGACVACLADADCDDGTFCNGAETCGTDNICAAGTDACTADQTCTEGAAAAVCADNCTVDTDCPDDTVFCNGTESCDEASGVCVSSGDPCADDDLFCTGTESCDEVTAACVATGDPCAAGETCNDTTDTCDTSVSCTTDADCTDDGLFCNGVTTCDLVTDPANGVCVTSADPCTATQTCTEGATGAVCTDPAGEAFKLTTANDALVGSSGADTFDGQFFLAGDGSFVMTLGNADSIDGGASTDTLNASTNAAGPFTPVSLTNIEVIDVSATTANTTLGLANADSVTTLKTSSSSVATTFSNVQTVPTNYAMTNHGQNMTTSITKSNALAGTTDALTLDLSSVTGGTFTAGPSAAGSGYETMTVNGNGGVANTLAGLSPGAGNSWATLNVGGTQDVTITAQLPGSVKTVNASGASGKVSVVMGTNSATVTGGSGDDTISFGTAPGDFSSSDTVDCGAGTGDTLVVDDADVIGTTSSQSNVSNCEKMTVSTAIAGNLNATHFGATTVNLAGTAGAARTVTLSDDSTLNLTAALAGGALTVSVDTDDGATALTLKLSGITTGQVITATDWDTVTVDSASGANTLDAALNLSTGLGTQKVVITGSQNLTTSATITAEEIDASAFTGVLVIGSAPTSAAGVILKGGSGGDTLLGTAAADEITGNAGIDIINGGDGEDKLTGGSEADTFQFVAGDQINAPGASAFEEITDFQTNSDIIDETGGALVPFANTNAAATGAAAINAEGIASFVAADDTLAERIVAAEGGINAGGVAAVRQCCVFEQGSDSYLFISDGTDGIGANDLLIKLTGVTGLTDTTLTGGNLTIK